MKLSVLAAVAWVAASEAQLGPPGFGPGFGPPGGAEFFSCIGDCVTSYFEPGNIDPRQGCDSTSEYFACFTQSCQSLPTGVVTAVQSQVDDLCSRATNCPASKSGTYTYSYPLIPPFTPGAPFPNPTDLSSTTVTITGCPVTLPPMPPGGPFLPGPPGSMPTSSHTWSPTHSRSNHPHPTSHGWGPDTDWEEWCQEDGGVWWGGGWECETRTSTVMVTAEGGSVVESTVLETVAVSSDESATTRITIGDAPGGSRSATSSGPTLLVPTAGETAETGTGTVGAATTTSSLPDGAGRVDLPGLWLLVGLGVAAVLRL